MGENQTENAEISEGGASALRKQLDEVIDKARVRTVFQPIVSLRDGSVLGYEALSRGPEDTPLQNPDALFGVAAEYGRLWDLEQLCRTKALESAYAGGQKPRLFLNVSPNVIRDEKFKNGFTKEYLRKFDIGSENISFEITEKNAAENLENFKKAIDHYKRQDYKIAIDDAGAGYSGLNMITDLHPQYIKLDMKLIRGIDRDWYKRALVKSLNDFCRIANTALIAEGIETEGELQTLIDIGVHYGQGYFLRQPNSEMGPVDGRVLETIRKRNTQNNNLYFHFLSSVYIGNLSRTNVTVPPEASSEQVYNTFLARDSLLGVAVVSDGKVAGAVTRSRIDHLMGGQFGFSLHARHPVSTIMDRNPLVTDFEVPIDVVSKMAMSRPAENLYDFIIVTRDGKYYGIVTIKDLLEKTMEIEVSDARHRNPLSGLPGNLAIERALSACIESDDPFTVLYIDLDNFKAYNDEYGFERGDGIIRFVAKLLSDLFGVRGIFVGHVGGDDFIAVLPYREEAEKDCRALINAFDRGVRRFYSKEDLERGYIVAKNRKGEEDRFPIMTISVAGVTNRERKYRNIYELSEHAGVVKTKCKQIWKSCCVLD